MEGEKVKKMGKKTLIGILTVLGVLIYSIFVLQIWSPFSEEKTLLNPSPKGRVYENFQDLKSSLQGEDLIALQDLEFNLMTETSSRCDENTRAFLDLDTLTRTCWYDQVVDMDASLCLQKYIPQCNKSPQTNDSTSTKTSPK